MTCCHLTRGEMEDRLDVRPRQETSGGPVGLSVTQGMPAKPHVTRHAYSPEGSDCEFRRLVPD